jgi:penicillin-binding protein 1A
VICEDCEPEPDALEEAEELVEKIEPEFRPLDITTGKQKLEGQTSGSGNEFRKLATEDNYARQAISPQNAYLVRSMMMDVVRRGTGARAMQLGRHDLAGKTGTTNEQRDAWFSGYNDHLVTSVWVGFDNHDPLGRRDVGGRAALPVWMEFMAIALDGVEDKPPAMPEGLAQAKIDPTSGMLARLDNSDAIMEIFEAGRLPPMQEIDQGDDQDVPLEEDPYEIY